MAAATFVRADGVVTPFKTSVVYHEPIADQRRSVAWDVALRDLLRVEAHRIGMSETSRSRSRA
jgi:hypothetical protein